MISESGAEFLEVKYEVTELSFPEVAFWFVAIPSKGGVSNLSCVAGADDAALNANWGPLLDACGI